MAGGKTSSHFRSVLAAFNETGERGQGRFRILLLRVQRHLVLRFEGKVAIAHAQELVDRARPILAAKGPKNLIVDLSLCEHITSPALGFISYLAMECTKQGGTVHIVKASELVNRTLKVLGLDRMSQPAESVDAVIDAEQPDAPLGGIEATEPKRSIRKP